MEKHKREGDVCKTFGLARFYDYFQLKGPGNR